MKYELSKYKFATFNDQKGTPTVAAFSTYAGRTVKGYAKCDPRDSYSLEDGKKLAAARCNARIAEKRVNRADKKVQDAMRQLASAQAYLARMQNYYADSISARDDANAEVANILSNM